LLFKKHGGAIVKAVDSLKFKVYSLQFTVKSQNKKTEDKDIKNKASNLRSFFSNKE